MKLINLTPHEVNIRRQDGTFLSIPPATNPARCTVTSSVVRVEDGISFSRAEFGEVTGLPEETSSWKVMLLGEEAPTYIVSMLVRQAFPHRRDLVSPGMLIRDENGIVVGCDGLTAS